MTEGISQCKWLRVLHKQINQRCFTDEITEGASQCEGWEWFTMWTDLRCFTQWMWLKVLHRLKQSKMICKW